MVGPLIGSQFNIFTNQRIECVRTKVIDESNYFLKSLFCHNTCFCGVAENLLCQVRLYIGGQKQKHTCGSLFEEQVYTFS